MKRHTPESLFSLVRRERTKFSAHERERFRRTLWSDPEFWSDERGRHSVPLNNPHAWQMLEDQLRLLVRKAKIEELEPVAAVGSRVKAGGRKGGTRAAIVHRERRERIIAAWHRIQDSDPGLPATATRKQIVEEGIACLRTVTEHTRDLKPKKREQS